MPFPPGKNRQAIFDGGQFRGGPSRRYNHTRRHVGGDGQSVSPAEQPTHPDQEEPPLMRTIILAAALLAAWPAFVSGQAPPQQPMPAVSPEVQPGGRATFRVRAANAKDVSLRGQWSREALKLTPDEGGVWSVTVEQV